MEISFQYPSDWILKEGDQVDLTWGYLGVVGNSLPNGVTVAAVSAPVEPPDDTAALEFLQVRVDRNITSDECNQSSFADLQKPGIPGTHLEATFPTGQVGTIQFTEAQFADGGLGHQAISRYYHVFRNHACYEFQLGLDETWTLRNSDDDLEDDFSELKDILATLTFRSLQTEVKAPPSPSGK
jgi:hypothetical protein